jgi:hypothetical protein
MIYVSLFRKQLISKRKRRNFKVFYRSNSHSFELQIGILSQPEKSVYDNNQHLGNVGITFHN